MGGLGNLEQVRDNIITRYRSEANDDWEWMDLGFYENRPENYNTSDHTFDIAAKLAKLDTTTNVAMTEFDRTIMMLTARGFDCTKLSQYNNGEPYTDSKGNEIDNLVAALYNYSGEYTINGPIFALLALDTFTLPFHAIGEFHRVFIDCYFDKRLSLSECCTSARSASIRRIKRSM